MGVGTMGMHPIRLRIGTVVVRAGVGMHSALVIGERTCTSIQPTDLERALCMLRIALTTAA